MVSSQSHKYIYIHSKTSKYVNKFDFAFPSKSKLPLVTSWSDSAATFMLLIALMGESRRIIFALMSQYDVGSASMV